MGFQNPLLVCSPVQGITNSWWCLVPNPSFVYISTQKKLKALGNLLLSHSSLGIIFLLDIFFMGVMFLGSTL